MTPNIYYISDMPFSLGFGGKEVQLLGYKSIVEKTCPQCKLNLLDPWDRFLFPKNSILHLFGSGKWFHNLLGQAKQKSEIRKLIISPTFYYDNAWKLKVGNFLSRLTPFEDQFSYKRYIFGAADTLVVNSHAEGLQIASVFGEKLKNKMLVIPNTIDDNYTIINDEESFLSKYQLSPGYVLSVGFWDERKNSLRMVQSFLQSFRHINRKLVLIGGGRFVNKRNGELMNKLLAENASSIVHIPFISNGSDILKSAYKNCAFHLLPSFVETPGIANIEALSFGKAIVVGECSPVREYFEQFAIYCKPTSTESISKAILIANDSVGSSSEGCSKRFVEDNFTHGAISERLKNLYFS